jgi:hypothetical protein
VSLLAGVALLVALESAAPAPATPPTTPPTTSPAPSTAAAPKAEILGLWKGSSICTKVQAAELCHDETVVYNFIDVPSQPATVTLKAARIVDGMLQTTFSIYVTYRPDEHRWTSEFEASRSRGIWTYVRNGDELTGSVALLPELTVLRNLTAKRVTRDQVLPH